MFCRRSEKEESGGFLGATRGGGQESDVLPLALHLQCPCSPLVATSRITVTWKQGTSCYCDGTWVFKSRTTTCSLLTLTVPSTTRARRASSITVRGGREWGAKRCWPPDLSGGGRDKRVPEDSGDCGQLRGADVGTELAPREGFLDPKSLPPSFLQ